MTSTTLVRIAVTVAAVCLGCGGQPTPAKERAPTLSSSAAQRVAASDDEALAQAKLKVLYFGNSHTGMHDIPQLVGAMIRFKHPQTTYASRHYPVGFLSDTANNPAAMETIRHHPWSFVVLQAQKISMSGKYRYSQKEGVALAKAAKAKGATVLFFSEWGRRGVPRDGVVQESIYQEMADTAGVRVAPIGRAWDVALAAKPSLPLYEGDGNHESRTGAFLTACVFYALFTDSDPTTLADFEYADVPKADRAILANAASKVWNDERAKGKQ